MNCLSRIQQLCAEQGKTIAEVEREANVGTGTIRRWGETLPSGDKLQRVAKVLGVTIDYLVNGEDLSSEKARAISRNMSSLSPDQLDLINNLINSIKSK